MSFRIVFLLIAVTLFSCEEEQQANSQPEPTNSDQLSMADDFDPARTQIYTSVKLTTDVGSLSEEDKELIRRLIPAAEIMNDLFWHESYGNKDDLLSNIGDEQLRRFAEINYGPWDRLDGNRPFIKGIGAKPPGANFYPSDMTKEEFESWGAGTKSSQYTMIRRDSTGRLESIWYHKYFEDEVGRVAEILKDAASVTTNFSLKYYLEQRADGIVRDRYNPSDVAWLNLENNTIDIIIGPIENYEDQLYGYKTAHEAYILVKDQEWSSRLDKYKEMLPRLQTELPVDEAYKKDKIGGNAQLNAYDVVFYAGDCNSGSKTIAVNLPNDEGLQQDHGTRRSQLKNAMRAKYDEILIPISQMLIEPTQRKHITFDAFFANTMFHEVAHGLGIKNTIDGNGTVRDALKDQASALEEGKADVLGLWMVTKLRDWGDVTEGELMDNYVTFLASIFRSVRFGASSAHGKANMLRFNYFQEMGAFTHDPDAGTYSVNPEKMAEAVESLSDLILRLQGDGDYDAVANLMVEKGTIRDQLQSDLDRLSEAGIPVDIVFEQGVEVLGLD